jgi:hypothetical protein
MDDLKWLADLARDAGYFGIALVLIFGVMFLGWKFIAQPAFDRAVEISRNAAAAAEQNNQASENNRQAAVTNAGVLTVAQRLIDTLQQLIDRHIREGR